MKDSTILKCKHPRLILIADNLVAAPDVGTRSRAFKGRATFGVTQTPRAGSVFYCLTKTGAFP
jgi:hypothetical protein